MQSFLLETKKRFLDQSLLSFLVKVFIGAQIIALFAQFQIPMYPVPITGQTLGVTIVGFALGAHAGTAAVILYLLEGIAGLPVFSNGGSGLVHFTKPSAGYLIGFIPSACILGYASDSGVLRSVPLSIAAALLSAIVTFAFGLVWLHKFIPSWEVTLQKGLYPFIIGGVIKALIASALVVPTYHFFRKL